MDDGTLFSLLHRVKIQTERQGISKNSPKSASDSELVLFFFFFSKPWAMKLSLSSAQRPLNAQILSLGKNKYLNKKFQQKTEKHLWNFKNRLERGKKIPSVLGTTTSICR